MAKNSIIFGTSFGNNPKKISLYRYERKFWFSNHAWNRFFHIPEFVRVEFHVCRGSGETQIEHNIGSCYYVHRFIKWFWDFDRFWWYGRQLLRNRYLNLLFINRFSFIIIMLDMKVKFCGFFWTIRYDFCGKFLNFTSLCDMNRWLKSYIFSNL